MDITQLKSEYDAVVKERDESINALKEKVKPEITNILVNVLKDAQKLNPKVEYFKWQQFTPYFNDGDVCEFEIRGIYGKLKDMTKKELENTYDGAFTEIYFSSYRKPIKKNNNSMSFFLIHEAIKSIPLEILKDIYGDGYQITVSETGVEIEEYEHD